MMSHEGRCSGMAVLLPLVSPLHRLRDTIRRDGGSSSSSLGDPLLPTDLRGRQWHVAGSTQTWALSLWRLPSGEPGVEEVL